MKEIPRAAKRRLVRLAALLSAQNSEKITSKTVQALTGWSDSLIRRDILTLGYKGGVSNGYVVKDLYDAICEGLKISEAAGGKKNCCIVGLGRLGAALLEVRLFEGSPFTLIAGFDSNVNRTEILRSTFPLYPASKLETVIAQQNIKFALLAVPESDAQKMAERLVNAGIKGIVNYTAVMLSLPVNVAVENASPVTALTNLAAESATDANSS
ncbi:redox-sensing transcriptional repressor Rex [Treponema parvum]|uniref:redox-sensing transcriptional repressor Rex n=1 Tax=Treponema parvum TaxID=138851 RepID=UPI001AEC6A8C|nr:redox-sensing transcriptional repressor Rex [Treponema parvum]QTQ15280.1 redox-sensing transcriptional repressor Rex [Treponema parvum]